MKRHGVHGLGPKIKRLRQKQGLLQVDLAVRVEVSTGYIGSIEQGIRYPSLKILQKIARTLKTSVSELLK